MLPSSQKSHHGVVPPGEHSQPAVVLANQLLDVGPDAFGLTLQHDEDGGMLTQLQQVQEALPGNGSTAALQQH